MPGAINSAGDTVYRKFSTRNTSGVPTTLAGTPAVSVYKAGSTTQSTTGVTLTVDFDSVTGLNHVAIDTSADGTFYADGSHFELVLTAGTVGGTSVVGEVVGSFDLSATVPADVVKVAGQTAYLSAGTATAGSSSSITLDAAEPTTADIYNGRVITLVDGTGAGQSRIITDYSTGRVASVTPDWTTTPSTDSEYIIEAYCPTEAGIADKLLGRNLAGGSDGGRTVQQALYFLRNKWTLAAGTLTVYATDDATSAWTSSVTTASGNPVTASDPA